MFLSNLQLYVGNLQVVRTEILTSNSGVCVKLAAVCWQPTGLKDGSLDNLDIKQGCFVKLASVCWQPTGLKDGSLDNLDIKQGCFCETCSCMGNLQVVGTAVLASNSGVFVKLASVCWQPTGLKDGSLDDLDIKQGWFCQTCSCMFATYRA